MLGWFLHVHVGVRVKMCPFVFSCTLIWWPPRPPSCAPPATTVSFCLWFSSGRSLCQPRACHLPHECKQYRLLQALTVVGMQSVVEKGL